jgi:hypothetical protein
MATAVGAATGGHRELARPQRVGGLHDVAHHALPRFLPPALLAQQLRRPPRERGDREERIDAERLRHDRAVEDMQPVVHRRLAIPARRVRAGVEHLTAVVHDTGPTGIAHWTSA